MIFRLVMLTWFLLCCLACVYGVWRLVRNTVREDRRERVEELPRFEVIVKGKGQI